MSFVSTVLEIDHTSAERMLTLVLYKIFEGSAPQRLSCRNCHASCSSETNPDGVGAFVELIWAVQLRCGNDRNSCSPGAETLVLCRDTVDCCALDVIENGSTPVTGYSLNSDTPLS